MRSIISSGRWTDILCSLFRGILDVVLPDKELDPELDTILLRSETIRSD